jgi:hypothetical protein
MLFLFFQYILPALDIALKDVLSLSIGTIILLALYFGLGVPLLLFEIALITLWEWN